VTDVGGWRYFVRFDEPGILEGDHVMEPLVEMEKSVRGAIQAIEFALEKEG
jgi:hypothetical protein